jgi:hypothetical protein
MGATPQFVLDSIDGPPSPPDASEGADSAALDACSKTVIAVAEGWGRPLCIWRWSIQTFDENSLWMI